MEIAQLGESIYNNQMQQSMYLCHSTICLKYGSIEHFGKAKAKDYIKATHDFAHLHPPSICPY